MIQYAEVPTSKGSWEVGEVVATDDEHGLITIRAEDGTLWSGCETQARFFSMPSLAMS